MGSRPWTVSLLPAVVLLAADQVSKALVTARLAPGASMPLLPGLPYPALTRVLNTGTAFGLLAGSAGLLVPLTAALLAALALFLTSRAAGLRLGPAGLAGAGLLLGGAAGNLVDRLRLGGVVDFVDLGFWPVFNLADVGVVAGALLLAWGVSR